MVNSLKQVQLETVVSEKPIKSKQHILAAIDIGTNSVHMVVVRIEPQLPAFTIIGREKDTVRLGDRDKKTGNINPVAMERAVAALQRCKDLAVSLKADQIIAVATSATREAPNGYEFLQRVERELGIVVNLISGQEEARRIYLGVLSVMDFSSMPHVIIDIGGGSTELILADSLEPRFLSSTKIGAVRLSQDFVTTDPISITELASLQAYSRGMLERPIDELRLSLKPREQFRLVATSGTAETLASIHALEKTGSIPNPLNGYQLSRRDIREMLRRFINLSYQQRLTLPGMSERRAEIIVAGSVILLEAMTMLDVDSLTVCERSLREGVIVDWMLTHGLIESRLRYQSEIRPRSVINIAQKYHVNLEYGQRVADFALSIFDQTQGILHLWGGEAREYLWAAAILHNCGLFISHSAHHKHSYYMVRNAELLGFTDIELEIIANLVRYHRKSKPKKKHENYNNLLSKENKILVNQLSAILRLAVALDRRQIGAIKELCCKYDCEYRVLHFHLIPSHPKDDCALELWNFDYKKNVFEEEFGVKLVTTLESIKNSKL